LTAVGAVEPPGVVDAGLMVLASSAWVAGAVGGGPDGAAAGCDGVTIADTCSFSL
jgi:hypothetical protein